MDKYIRFNIHNTEVQHTSRHTRCELILMRPKNMSTARANLLEHHHGTAMKHIPHLIAIDLNHNLRNISRIIRKIACYSHTFCIIYFLRFATMVDSSKSLFLHLNALELTPKAPKKQRNLWNLTSFVIQVILLTFSVLYLVITAVHHRDQRRWKKEQLPLLKLDLLVLNNNWVAQLCTNSPCNPRAASTMVLAPWVSPPPVTVGYLACKHHWPGHGDERTREETIICLYISHPYLM